MIDQALSYVDPTERDTWVRMGMAIKSELGDPGFEVWDQWSQQADNYQAGAAKAVWRSLSPGGGVGIGSLYFEARQAGWTGEGATERPIVRSRICTTDPAKELRRAAARIEAQSMLDRAARAPHNYLGKKGFPLEVGLCLDGKLLVPMRDHRTNQLNSIQSIAADGTKKFLTGGKASGSVFRMGNGSTRWLVEGFATALSVRAALRSLYCNDPVVACFSAHNLTNVPGSFVVADNDESGTGEKYALKTGLPYWMPPEIGDANDHHRQHGLPALADALRTLRNSQ